MKLVKSVGSPTRISAISARSRFLTSGQGGGGQKGGGGGGPLRALVLEAAAGGRGRGRGQAGGGVARDEVLAASLTDEPRIAPIVANVPADGLPHRLERRRRAGEVD